MFETFYSNSDVLIFADEMDFDIASITSSDELTRYFCRLVRMAADKAEGPMTLGMLRIARLEVLRYARHCRVA